MSIHGVAHQKAAIAARIVGQRGEATSARIIDETPSPRLEAADAGKEQEQEQSLPRLLEQVLARENLRRAWKRVKKNRGAAGVDGKDILQTGLHLQSAWPQIRQALLTGRYRPEPVRRVMIEKPDGSLRELGIPTVTDRLIQQALLQVLQPMIDPSFSEHSHGFRPGRRAQDAVLKAQQHVQAGYPIVVDVDLEKCFDRINHDVLMERLKRRDRRRRSHPADPSVLECWHHGSQRGCRRARAGHAARRAAVAVSSQRAARRSGSRA